jgi:hypothetical protein
MKCKRCNHPANLHSDDWPACSDTTKKGLPCKCPGFVDPSRIL